jgi:predicted transcriptional regulator
VNIVGAALDVNQRHLSRQMNLSLGMTNMLLRRLVTKGYIRIQQLNKRKVQYLLTPKGFAEKMRKSVKYTLKTINSIGLIKKQLAEVLAGLYVKGHRKFCVLGTPDLKSLIEMVLQENYNGDCEVLSIKKITDAPAGSMVLICTEEDECPADGHIACINILHELAKEAAHG